MRPLRLFSKNYPQLRREFLCSTFNSPLGIYIRGVDKGLRYALALNDLTYSFVCFDTYNLNKTISFLKDVPRDSNLMVTLDFKKKHVFDSKEKDIYASFALLYDFVDAFVISSYSDLSVDIDPIINLRMYNDEYRPILLKVENDFLYEDLDEIIAYSMLSNIDGLVISNSRLLHYAKEKCSGALCLIAGNCNDLETAKEALNDGASLVMSNTDKCPYLFAKSGRKIISGLR